METVTNAYNAASKAIFGEGTTQSGSEPVSGETGAGTVDEPYDQGNEAGMSKQCSSCSNNRKSRSLYA